MRELPQQGQTGPGGQADRGSAHTIREELHFILLLLGLMWAVHLVGWLAPSIKQYGLQPGTAPGLIGILTMPLLHGGLTHLISNTVPLLVLLALLAGSRANSIAIVVMIWLLSGGLLWAFAFQRDANHIGASGLVYGLIIFLILSGVLERRPLPLLASIIVLVMYGASTSLWAGMLPQQRGLSWDGHLYGAVGGGLVAYRLAKVRADKA